MKRITYLYQSRCILKEGNGNRKYSAVFGFYMVFSLMLCLGMVPYSDDDNVVFILWCINEMEVN